MPGHALFLFNNPFVVEQAQHLATHLITSIGSDEQARVRLGYRQSLQRDPDPEELYRAVELVQSVRTESGSEEKAWATFCQALLASNEFRYID